MIFVVVDLEQFLSYLFHVSRDGYTNPSREADHNIAISEPLICCYVAVDILKCQFDWVFSIVYVE